MKAIQFACILCFLSGIATAQFAPQAPLAGNDAIQATDPRIQSWAESCTIIRGWKNISDTTLGKTTMGSESAVSGAPDMNVLSLGDGGSAIITFTHPIKNGPGPDFAVFENGFANPINAQEAYLEFAFVEVSSDGAHYFRFSPVSNTQDTTQIDNFTYMDARLVHNLAGKYINGYGTPFDLEELKNESGLDVNNVRFVKVIDVVGSLDSVYASYDKNGRIINDPFPSPYPSGGFDLEAIAVLNQQTTGIDVFRKTSRFTIYPNPSNNYIFIKSEAGERIRYSISDIGGRIIQEGVTSSDGKISWKHILPGIYFLQCMSAQNRETFKIRIL